MGRRHLGLAAFIMNVDGRSYEEAYEHQAQYGDISFYEGLAKTDYTVSGKDGYVLHVRLLENPAPTDDYVIITHGITDNLVAAVKYVGMYMDLGYNCITYDLRGHGRNESTFITYGIREAEDLMCLIRDTRERYPGLASLGLHGESLGTATSITCLKYKPEVDFVVADCGFADIENVLKGQAPGLLVDIANVAARIRYGYALKDMRPIDALDDNEVPVLFIHGGADTLISPENSAEMAKRTKGPSECHIIPGAEHALSIIAEPEMYREIVGNWLKGLRG